MVFFVLGLSGIGILRVVHGGIKPIRTLIGTSQNLLKLT